MRRLPALRALSLLTLGLAACAQQPEGAAQPGAEPVGPPPPRLALADATSRLPADAAGFRRGRSLPARPPAQGREVAYATLAHHQRAAALVRLAPAPETPDGPDSPAASAAFQAELNEQVAGRDRARHLHETARFAVTAAGRPALTCAQLAGTLGRQPVEGLVCGGAVGGNILRLKVSQPRHEPSIADMRAFAAAIVGALEHVCIDWNRGDSGAG